MSRGQTHRRQTDKWEHCLPSHPNRTGSPFHRLYPPHQAAPIEGLSLEEPESIGVAPYPRWTGPG